MIGCKLPLHSAVKTAQSSSPVGDIFLQHKRLFKPITLEEASYFWGNIPLSTQQSDGIQAMVLK